MGKPRRHFHTVFVSGASGILGSAIVRELLKARETSQTEYYTVYAGVNCLTTTNSVELKTMGAHLIQIDFQNPKTLVDVLRGCEKVLVVPTSNADKAMYSQIVIDYAHQVRIREIVLISVVNCDKRQDYLGRMFYSLEQYMMQGVQARMTSGARTMDISSHGEVSTKFPSPRESDHIIIRIGVPMQNFLSYQSQIKRGVLRLPFPDYCYFAPVHIQDIVTFVHQILADPSEKYINKGILNVVGPELLNGRYIAEVAGKVLKKSVTYELVDMDTAKRELRELLLGPKSHLVESAIATSAPVSADSSYEYIPSPILGNTSGSIERSGDTSIDVNQQEVSGTTEAMASFKNPELERLAEFEVQALGELYEEIARDALDIEAPTFKEFMARESKSIEEFFLEVFGGLHREVKS